MRDRRVTGRRPGTVIARPVSAMGRGTIEYGDVILVITSITLRDGAFLVIAEGTGPLEAYNGPFRMYGPDGVLVQEGGTGDFLAAGSGQTMHAEVTLTPESPEAAP